VRKRPSTGRSSQQSNAVNLDSSQDGAPSEIVTSSVIFPSRPVSPNGVPEQGSSTTRFRVPDREPPNTPKSNFTITTPLMSSSSEEDSSSQSSSDGEVKGVNPDLGLSRRSVLDSEDDNDDGGDEGRNQPTATGRSGSRSERSVFGIGSSSGAIAEAMRRRRHALEGRSSEDDIEGLTDVRMVIMEILVGCILGPV
jgi:hypothetical protein